jgi:hypothetical protein
MVFIKTIKKSGLFGTLLIHLLIASTPCLADRGMSRKEDVLNIHFSSNEISYNFRINQKEISYKDGHLNRKIKVRPCNYNHVELLRQTYSSLRIFPFSSYKKNATSVTLAENDKLYNLFPNSELAIFLESIPFQILKLGQIEASLCKR